jgi:hypothetical protein
LELVEIKTSWFADDCPCTIYKSPKGFLGTREGWYIFKDKNEKWYYNGTAAIFDSKPYNSLDELFYDRLK